MQRYLIEVEHEPDFSACLRAIEVFLKTGSHFLTNADWGCRCGEHKAWIIVDMDSEEEARCIVPPEFRTRAKIVEVSKFTMDEVDEMRAYHVG